MNAKFPHVDALLEFVLCFPGDGLDYMDAAKIVVQYKEAMQKIKGDGPHDRALHNELTTLLQESDDALVAEMEKSWEWEHGMPDVQYLRGMFTAYINEIDK